MMMKLKSIILISLVCTIVSSCGWLGKRQMVVAPQSVEIDGHEQDVTLKLLEQTAAFVYCTPFEADGTPMGGGHYLLGHEAPYVIPVGIDEDFWFTVTLPVQKPEGVSMEEVKVHLAPNTSGKSRMIKIQYVEPSPNIEGTTATIIQKSLQ